VRYSTAHLAPEVRPCLPALALFEGVVDVNALALFSKQEAVPERFRGITRERWTEVLAALVQVGLLSALDLGLYRLHPALPAYLAYTWQEQAGEAFAVERQAARGALLSAFADLGRWLFGQIGQGSAEMAFAVLEQERRTLGELVAWALEAGRYGEA
jgi:hypothetical protein